MIVSAFVPFDLGSCSLNNYLSMLSQGVSGAFALSFPAPPLSSPTLPLQGTPNFFHLGSWKAFQPSIVGTLELLG